MFSYSSLESILIPRGVEILESKHFVRCQSFSPISCESPLRLARIESIAFSYSSLGSLLIPRSVQSIHGSALMQTELSSISIEYGNEIMSMKQSFPIDILHRK
jgi:hypothetical protein